MRLPAWATAADKRLLRDRSCVFRYVERRRAARLIQVSRAGGLLRAIDAPGGRRGHGELPLVIEKARLEEADAFPLADEVCHAPRGLTLQRRDVLRLHLECRAGRVQRVPEKMPHRDVQHEGRDAAVHPALWVEQEVVDREFDRQRLVGVMIGEAEQLRQEEGLELRLVAQQRIFERAARGNFVHRCPVVRVRGAEFGPIYVRTRRVVQAGPG